MEKNLVLDVSEHPKRIRDWLLFAIQHILAMFVACITVPLLTGLPIDATIVSAGIGTLFYIVVTKGKSPVFLSSSFAYIAPITSALALGSAVSQNFLAVMIGMGIVGLIYVLIAIIIHFAGTKWINVVLPPIVIGPVIMCIGLGLASGAISNLTGGTGESYSLMNLGVGLIAMLLTAVAAHYGKKTIKLIPFVVGIVGAYIVAAILTLIGHSANVEVLKIIDFSPLIDNFKEVSFESFIKLPDFIFLKDLSTFDASQLPEIIMLFAPVAIVTVCEHLGDHLNLSNIINKDLTKDPGLTRTLIGDGVATAISGCCSGVANTTYGENVAVIGVSKIASTSVIALAALMTIGIGFVRPLMCLVETIPACITGGVSLILYGFIASSGVQLILKNKVDVSKTKNIFVISVILVAGIGGLALNFGQLTITSIAASMILGIILNLILRDKKEENKTVVVVEASPETETETEE